MDMLKNYSEQFVLGASNQLLIRQASPDQHPDSGLSPLIMVPIDEKITSCDELMARRDEFFPKEPDYK